MEPTSAPSSLENANNDQKKDLSYKKIQEFLSGLSYVSDEFASQDRRLPVHFQTSIAIHTLQSSSTTRPHISGFNEFRKILETSIIGVDEFEEEDLFSQRITGWIERYEFETLDIISEFYTSREINDKTMSHILMALGNANNYKTYNERLMTLKKYLRSPSSTIRYGAVIGILNLDDPKAIPALLKVLKEEPIPIIRGTIKSVINQLRETERK